MTANEVIEGNWNQHQAGGVTKKKPCSERRVRQSLPLEKPRRFLPCPPAPACLFRSPFRSFPPSPRFPRFLCPPAVFGAWVTPVPSSAFFPQLPMCFLGSVLISFPIASAVPSSTARTARDRPSARAVRLSVLCGRCGRWWVAGGWWVPLTWVSSGSHLQLAKDDKRETQQAGWRLSGLAGRHHV